MRTQRDIGYLDKYLDLFSSPASPRLASAARPARNAPREARP